MTSGHRLRGPGFFVLCCGLVFAAVLFGAPIPLSLPARSAVVAAQLAVIGAAAWSAGLALIRTSSDSDRKVLAAATLLILPVALFSFMPGFGPPEFADHARNAFRYVVLLVDAVAVLSGMMLLQDVLQASGEHLYGRLGFALIVAATPLYLVWSALLLEGHRASLADASWAGGPWNNWLMSFSDILLFFGGLLTYAATALFTISLWRVQWIGVKASMAFLALNILAALCLVVRGVEFPDPAVVVAQGYTIPGWIAGIPAVPWFLPCIFGLILLRRTARSLEPPPRSPSIDPSPTR